LSDVNPAIRVDAFVNLIIAAVTCWFYGFLVVALEVRNILTAYGGIS
jgi:hypothetical protein